MKRSILIGVLMLWGSLSCADVPWLQSNTTANIGTAESNNLIRNGDFEEDISEWILEIHTPASATASYDSATASSGSGSVQIKISSLQSEPYGWHIQFKQVEHSVEKDRLYQLSFSARAESEKSINVAVGKESSPWTNYGLSKQFYLSPNWQRYSVYFLASASNSGDVRISFELGNDETDVWLDEVIFREATSPSPRIEADFTEVISTINPLIYGNNIQWIENGDTCWDVVNKRVYPELIETLKGYNIPIMRFPGGCLTHWYHWQDGIGPVENRPLGVGGWGETYENNFGTDEFMKLCKGLGASAIITANVESGTPEEAANWVEYMNGTVSTTYGAKRAANGHPEPYNVKYWELGNEIEHIEHLHPYAPPLSDISSSEYAQMIKEFVSAMKAKDPTIKIGAVAMPPGWKEDEEPLWNETILKEAGTYIDFFILHCYAGFTEAEVGDDVIFRCIQSHPYRLEEMIRGVQRIISQYAPGVKIYITEYNTFYNEGWFWRIRTLESALYNAAMLQIFMRNNIDSAQYWGLIGDCGFSLLSKYPSLQEFASLKMFELYTNHFGDELVETLVDSPFYPVPLTLVDPWSCFALPCLSALASKSSDGSYLAVINHAYDEEITTEVNLNGINPISAEVLTLQADRVTATTTATLLSSIYPVSDSFQYTFPAHSITAFRFIFGTPHITLHKTCDKKYTLPGGTLTYTITYTNEGQGTATEVVIIEVLPEKCKMENVKCKMQNVEIRYWYNGGWQTDFSGSATKLKWLIPEVAPGASGTVIFTVEVK